MSKFIKAFALLLVFFITTANAWEPSKPIKVVIAYGPGSGNEILFRKVESIVTKQNSNIKFIIEFKPGANELVGANYFSQSGTNDGHLIFVPAIGVWIASPVWYKKLMVQDPIEWQPVVNLGEASLALFASTSSKVNNPNQFIQAVKSGEKINVGTGAGVHLLAYEYINNQLKGSNTQKVQFNSPAAVVQAVAGNQIEFGIVPLPLVLDLVKADKIKIIGVTGNVKTNYPNLSDSIKGLDLVAHIGIVLPKGTDKEIIDYYVNIFSEAVNSTEYQDFLKETSWYDSMRTHNNFKTFLTNQRKKWIPVAESIKID